MAGGHSGLLGGSAEGARVSVGMWVAYVYLSGALQPGMETSNCSPTPPCQLQVCPSSRDCSHIASSVGAWGGPHSLPMPS